MYQYSSQKKNKSVEEPSLFDISENERNSKSSTKITSFPVSVPAQPEKVGIIKKNT